MRIGGCVVKAGCIGSVGTPPEHRRKGYGVGVLHDTDRYMYADGYDFSALFTGVRVHYSKGGWVVHPIRFFQAELPETFAQPASDVEVSLFEDEDLPGLQAVYDSYNCRRTGTFVRSQAYWEHRPRWRPQNPDEFLIARRDGEIVAYCCGRDGNVREACALPGCEDAMAAALTALFKTVRDSGRTEVRAGLPADAGPVLEAIGCRIRRNENANPMVRLVNLPSFLEKLAPLFAERLKSIPSAGSIDLRFRTELESCALQIEGGRLLVADRNVAAVEVPVSHEQMIGLLLGGLTIDHVVAANRLSLDETVIGMLRAVFPADELHHWEWDSY